MIEITQNKIAGFEPRWAPFCGFSVLFDNPAQSTRQAEGLEKIDCSFEMGGQLELYRWLDASVDELGREDLIRTYLFCPLPATTYHVTVWDGVNTDNIGSVRPDLRPYWAEFLRALPESLATPPGSMTLIQRSKLVGATRGPITFEFETLDLWRNQALVARLRPVGRSAENFRNLYSARAELCEKSKMTLGVAPPQSYLPHVTLGYFANQKVAAPAQGQLSQWNDLFRTALATGEITFTSTAVYGFTDMVNFWKLAPRE